MTALMGQSELVTIVIYLIVGILASARLTRLLTADDFPPSIRIRIFWDNHVTGPWNKLVHCHWCFAPYAVAFVGVLAVLCDYWGAQLYWFVAFGWLAASYIASMVVQFDEG